MICGTQKFLLSLHLKIKPIKCTSMKEFFQVTAVSREDLKSKGFDVSNVTDEQMEELARRLGDDYVEQMFWISLPIIAEAMGIPMDPNFKEDDDE